MKKVKSEGRRSSPLTSAYARWRASRLGRITDALETSLVCELVDPKPGLRILDVGCGDGMLAAVLAGRGAEVIGLDADEVMLAAARARVQAAEVDVCFMHGDALALPFPDKTFDRVTASTLLCLVGDSARALSEMARVLKPGGRLVLGDLGAWSLWAFVRRLRGALGAPRWRSARFFSARDLRRLATEAGLRPTTVRGAAYYAPVGAIAALMAPLDPWLGRRVRLGAAFLALSAQKPLSECKS